MAKWPALCLYAGAVVEIYMRRAIHFFLTLLVLIKGATDPITEITNIVLFVSNYLGAESWTLVIFEFKLLQSVEFKFRLVSNYQSIKNQAIVIEILAIT